ncbi:hypothetical protein [Thalassobaculum sp.]|uniref:hypothetical protein n=1 Tax=Thalassobaculum sp. TaxID=2022740 RepID=UPI0032ECD2CC
MVREDFSESHHIERFLFLWYSELIERVARCHHYVSLRAAAAPTVEGKKLRITYLLIREVSSLASDLRRLATHFYNQHQSGRKFDDATLSTHGIQLKFLSQRYVSLHASLYTVPTPWAPSHLQQFVTALLNERLQDPGELFSTIPYALSPTEGQEAWATVLTSTYNFANILSISDPLRDGQRLVPDTLGIPATERTNFVIWPNLLHELAHSFVEDSPIYKSNDITELASAAIKEIDPNSTLETRARHTNTLLMWTPEILCDLFATDALGPLYYLSFSRFALFWAQSPIHQHDNLYPSVHTRLSYIRARLSRFGEVARRISRIVDAPWALRGRVDALHPERQDKVLASVTADMHPSDAVVVEYCRRIASHPLYKKYLAFSPVESADYSRIASLQARVEKGEFIGTQRSSNDHDCHSDSSLSNIARSLVEYPSRTFDMIAASMLDRFDCNQWLEGANPQCNSDQDRIIVGLFISEGDLHRNLDAVWKDVERHDVTFLKSLEVNSIARFYSSEGSENTNAS